MASTAYPPRSSSSAFPGAASAVKSTINAPSGTFLPGTKVQVGGHRVTIEKYLSEGGFAHVYVVRVPREGNKHELAVLKRVAVPDKEHLANMRTEVETMKKLRGHERVVTYIDSHASQLKGGGYEVFLLMEYCSGGGLIDFMNTRLQHRLTEPEILKIFGDCAEGVACMHYLKPPLLHRDLKVENVLISKNAKGNPVYKICDFGSAAPPRPAAKTAEEGRLIEEDVQKHTTMQYRSPEMIDVWRKVPIDEKSDIWALGVLLYKLCYYTTPFEDVGQMAILNASYKYPNYPSFSPRLKKFIASMLQESPKDRPNIYQVVKEACSMRGTDVPIKDIYAHRTQSEARRNETLPQPEPPMSVGLSKEAPKQQVQSLPDIAPMRRGRPTAPGQQQSSASAKPSPSPAPARGDPFAALDSKNYDIRAGAVDELSKKFPSLEEFSITQDKGAFSPPPRTDSKPKGDLNERMTNALADAVFSQGQPPAQAQLKAKADIHKSQSVAQMEQAKVSPTKPTSVKDRVREVSKQSPLVHQPTPVRPATGSKYTSTGVGASPPGSATKSKFPEISSRPIWKVPGQQHRSSSQPRASEDAQASARALMPSLPPSQRPALLDVHRSKSQTAQFNAAKSPTSSRPSLEGHRPSQMDLGESNLSRAKSAQSRTRPSSAYVSSNLDYLRDQEMARKRPSMEGRRHSRQASQGPGTPLGDESNIEDDMDYLRHSESNEGRPTRKGSGHKKRSSLGAIQSGAKNIFAGRFGDAFKRFENNATEEGPQTPEPRNEDLEPPLLSPIEGSQPTPSKHSDAGSAIDETEDLPADVRRELERQRLGAEEKRVAEAAAQYRAKVGGQGTGTSNSGGGGPSRASTIQKRVQSLLDEGRQEPAQSKRTAEGYGRYTDEPAESSPEAMPMSPPQTQQKTQAPPVARKPPAPMELQSKNPYPKTRQQPSGPQPTSPAMHSGTASAPPQQFPASSGSAAPAQQARVVSRPSVPPKSQALRTGGGGGGAKPQWPPQSQAPSQTQQPSGRQQKQQQQPAASSKPSGGLAALLAKDLEGVPDYPPPGSSGAAVDSRSATLPARGEERAVGNGDLVQFDGQGEEDDLEADFSKRYPSLGGMETGSGVGSDERGRTMREV